MIPVAPSLSRSRTSRRAGALFVSVGVVLAVLAGLTGLSGCSVHAGLEGPLGGTRRAGGVDADTSSAGAAPLVERREILTATGYAVIAVQNHRNPAQQRLMAIRASKLDAYRSLTEQVYGHYLDATTTVADLTVQSDSFRSRVEGVIYGATVVSITPVGDDTYETTLSLDRSVVRELRAWAQQQWAARRL